MLEVFVVLGIAVVILAMYWVVCRVIEKMWKH
jgi:hypothetical protein